MVPSAQLRKQFWMISICASSIFLSAVDPREMILVATAEASLPHLRDLNDALCCTLVKSILRSTVSLSLRFTSLHCTLFWDAVL